MHRVSCASGQDLIEARDGARADQLRAGHRLGRVDANDIVENYVDLSDQCESVDGAGAPAATAGGAAPTFKVVSAKADRRRRVIVRVTVPGPGKVTVRALSTRLRASRAVRTAGEVKLTLKSSRRQRLRLRLRLRSRMRRRAARR